jgi:hypothetical protein
MTIDEAKLREAHKYLNSARRALEQIEALVIYEPSISKDTSLVPLRRKLRDLVERMCHRDAMTML